jgi:hypothetical protein
MSFPVGSEESIAAEAKAVELLEIVVRLGNISSSKTNTPTVDDIVGGLHNARDKHIFRILATIVDPNHTMSARKHALDELPKRTKVLGNGVSDWIRSLVNRCSMSNFLNGATVHHTVLLAQELFRENDIAATSITLASVKVAVESFPVLGAIQETFVTLTELFSDCRRKSSTKLKKELDCSGIVTGLSSILSAASSARSLVIVSCFFMDKPLECEPCF